MNYCAPDSCRLPSWKQTSSSNMSRKDLVFPIFPLPIFMQTDPWRAADALGRHLTTYCRTTRNYYYFIEIMSAICQSGRREARKNTTAKCQIRNGGGGHRQHRPMRDRDRRYTYQSLYNSAIFVLI